MLKLVVMLLQMAGVLPAESDTYIILNSIGDAAFYFLPIMVAASAAKKFKTNVYLAMAIAGVLLYPDFRTLMESVTVGDTAAHFLGIPIASVKYTHTVIPAFCMTWVLSYIERAIDKITPAVTKNFLKPMLIILVAAPIAILIIGPLGITIGEGISAAVEQRMKSEHLKTELITNVSHDIKKMCIRDSCCIWRLQSFLMESVPAGRMSF